MAFADSGVVPRPSLPNRVAIAQLEQRGTVAARWTDLLVQTAAGRGQDTRSLLARIEVEPSRLSDPAYRVPEAQHLALWGHIMRAVHDPAFPLEHAQEIRIDDYGLIGLACKTAPDLETAYQCLGRFLHLSADPVGCRLELSSSAHVILERPGPRSLGMRCAVESAVAELLVVSRELCAGPIRPLKVHFLHTPPSSREAHEAFFGCAVQYESTYDGIELDVTSIKQPLRLSDDGLFRFLQLQLEELESKGASNVNVPERVRHVIGNSLAGGPPRIEDVARELGMSVRTLQRYLATCGTSFQLLLKQTRIELALRMMADSDRSLGEIAFLLGFSEASAFHRAFRRWNGETPQRYRRRLLASARVA